MRWILLGLIVITTSAVRQIAVAPSSVSWSVVAGQVPPVAVIKVTTSNGARWQTFDQSPFYDASSTCAANTCASGASTTLVPNAGFFTSAGPGTYTYPLTIRASGLPDSIVAVTAVVSAATPPPTPVGANEPFRVRADHNGADTTNYSLTIDGNPAGTKSVSTLLNGTIEFIVATGLPAGPHTIVVSAIGEGGTTPSAVFSITLEITGIGAPKNGAVIK